MDIDDQTKYQDIELDKVRELSLVRIRYLIKT